MERVEKDEAREHRIDFEAVVDAYDEIERAMGWYYYLDGRLAFPFKAKCIAERATSPLRLGDVIEVFDMAPEDECKHDMLVRILWQGRSLTVSVSQLEGIAVDHYTEETISDWHYWVGRGYTL